MTKSDIIDAARALRRMLRDADEDTLNAAYQVIANDANDSKWAYTHEPMSGLAVACQAEFRQRAHMANAGNDATEAS
jgi:hypothetical protein